MPRTPRPPGPNDRVIICGTIHQLHSTHVVLGVRGAHLYFPEGTSARDFKINSGDHVTMTVARVGSKYCIEKVAFHV
jgi:hypothetical protein